MEALVARVVALAVKRFVLKPRIPISQFVFLNQFSGDPPAGGSPARRATQGIAWSATAPTHVEAQNPSYYFSQQFFRVTRALAGHSCGARYAVNRAGCDSTDSC